MREKRERKTGEREREGKMKTKNGEREREGLLGGKGLEGVVKLSEQWWSDEITDKDIQVRDYWDNNGTGGRDDNIPCWDGARQGSVLNGTGMGDKVRG